MGAAEAAAGGGAGIERATGVATAGREGGGDDARARTGDDALGDDERRTILEEGR